MTLRTGERSRKSEVGSQKAVLWFKGLKVGALRTGVVT